MLQHLQEAQLLAGAHQGPPVAIVVSALACNRATVPRMKL